MAATNASGLTEEQRTAIERRGVSIALSAGAGCGKTHVLVERFLAALTPATNGDESGAKGLSGLIAITFTDRAAREMRDRLRRKCRERLRAADDRHADDWLGLLRELESARVSTIHAFCGSLLRAHAVEAGIDPHFQILQAGPSATLFSEVVEDQLREQLGQMNEDLLDLVVMFGLVPLRQMMQKLLGRRHAIDFDEWVLVTPEELVERWHEVEVKEVLPQLRAQFLKLPEVASLRRIMANWTPTNNVMRDRFVSLTAALNDLASGEEFYRTIDAIRDAARVQGGGSRKDWFSDEIYNEFRDAATAVRDWAKDAEKRSRIEAKGALPSAAAGLALLRVARPVIAAYEDRKRELSLLDFDDLLARTRDLLHGAHGETLRRRLASRLDLLLVDEFQDTDPLQVELVKVLCGGQLQEGKLFFVGDAKQSIYRFRGADPRVFRELQGEIPRAGQLPLTRNFRSQPGVLDFVNALFRDRLGGTEYEALVAHRPALAESPIVEFLWATPPADNTEKIDAEFLRKQEAEWIARRVAQILATGQVTVPADARGPARSAGPGDVTILFRTLSDVRYYEEALRRHDLPYYTVGGGAYYAQQEVFDLLNLLRAIDAPGDVVSLAGALRSPFFSLTDETLYWLAQHEKGLAAGLFAAALPAQIEGQQRRQVQFAAKTLHELRAQKDRRSVVALIRHALARTGYDALLLAEFLGERKLANLRKLIDQARIFDASGIFTLSDFIHELSEFVARQPDEPPAPVELETSTVIRLMTIHQAKGLEFPIVVVPDLMRSQNGSPVIAAFDPRLGPLVRAKDEDAGACGFDLWRALEEQEEADEGIRLLYVAATRAADYLILSAGIKDFDKPSGWLEFLGERFDLRSGSLQAHLPGGWSQPRVTVTLERPPTPHGADSKPRVEWDRVIAEARECAAAGRGVSSPLVEPVPPDHAARRVFSFSRLAGQFESEELPARDKDAFARLATEEITDEPAGSATELGVLAHAVLAQIDFAAPGDVLERCRDELARRFSSSETRPESAAAMIERFLQSPRATALREAAAVHRELEFLLRWPPGGPADGRLIQGFIDCLYQDRDGRWHLLDYKTNRVTAAAVPQLAARYELQMSLYAIAVEEVLGESPATLTLCFLQPGVEHVVPWNGEARKHAIEQINSALTAAIAKST
ncbi:MAG TPA: UvrD-helicase domain-containing protein [Pirellulales bacterium]|nr:UvrD-helicase domain-containing protein [Pirellulales bacterium]